MTATSAPTIEQAADLLWEAENETRAMLPLSVQWPDLNLATAYAIQDVILERRLARGDRLVGIKLGLTSRAKQQRMGISEPTVSWLTDAMVLPANQQVGYDHFIHPRAEPEIVFCTRAELSGPGVTASKALAAVETVHAGIEIIDSRYRNYSFTLADTVSDNSSSGALTISGDGISPRAVDLALEAVLLEVDGQIHDSATGAAVLGHPVEALAWAVNQLGSRGHSLPAGSVVLTGGMTDAVPVAGRKAISAHFTHLGSVTVCGSNSKVVG